MRRVALSCTGPAAAAAVVAVGSSAVSTPVREIYTTWGSIPNEGWATKEPWIKRITNQSKYRSFTFWHVQEVEMPPGVTLSPVELYLLSCIEDDIGRLMHIDWTYDFDPFWHDRVNSHVLLFKTLYSDEYPIYKFIFGDRSHNVEGKQLVEKRLNYLKSVLIWAAKTERRYSAIAKTRFEIQRSVWNAVERERMLASCYELVEAFRGKIPAEFEKKAIGELENHLVNVRHWVWDCPNAKRTFTRQLA